MLLKPICCLATANRAVLPMCAPAAHPAAFLPPSWLQHHEQCRAGPRVSWFKLLLGQKTGHSEGFDPLYAFDQMDLQTGSLQG